MADDEKKVLVSKRECRWVRSLLPLWVGDGCPEQSAGPGEGGDLSAEDHLRVEGHLAVCPSCRRQQVAMGRAFRALYAARAESPVDGAAASLWPVLQRRIDGEKSSLAGGRSRPAFGLPDRLSDLFGALDRARLGAGSLVAYAAVALLLLSLVMGTIAQRQRMGALATIDGNTAPIDRVLAPAPVEDVSTKLADLDEDGQSMADDPADPDPALSRRNFDGSGRELAGQASGSESIWAGRGSRCRRAG